MNFNSLIPELSVSDINKSISFYVNHLGFKIEYQREEVGFAFLSLNDVQLMIEQNNDNWNTGTLEYPYGRGVNFQLRVDDVSQLLNRLKDYPLFVPLKDNWYRVNDIYYGFRQFLVLDPDGYLLRFSQEIGVKDAL